MKNNPSRILPILFFTLLLDTIGFGMVLPIIPVIFTDQTSPSFLLHGYSDSMQYVIAGATTALFGLMQFFASPLLGELSDVYGRKKLLRVGVAVLAFSQFLFGIGIEISSIALILFARTVAGLAAANFSIAQATIADVSEPHNRAKNFGLMGAAFGLGFVLGPLLGGWISSATGNPAYPFWAASILGIGNVIFLSLFLQETHHDRKAEHSFTLWKGFANIRQAFTDIDARAVYLSNFLYVCGFTFFTSFIGILLVQSFSFTEASVGTFFGAVGLWIVFAQAVVLPYLSKRHPERTLLRWCIPFVAVTVAAYPFVGGGWWLYVLIPIMALPQGVSMANFSALISKSVSAQKQGAALGINGSLQALSQGIVPIMAGVGSGVMGVASPFVIGGLLICTAWLVLFGPVRRGV